MTSTKLRNIDQIAYKLVKMMPNLHAFGNPSKNNSAQESIK